jgi:hypothetical protein
LLIRTPALDNLDARINPILHVQALTLKAVSLNQAMNQEINIAHVRLESYTDTVLLSHVNSNILTTQEFNTVALPASYKKLPS